MEPKEGIASQKPSRPLGRLALIMTFVVIFFMILTQRMMLNSESSALQMLVAGQDKFMEMLHKNHGDAIEQTTAASDIKRLPKPTPAWKPTNQSLTNLLADYVGTKSSSKGNSTRVRGGKVKQKDLVEEESIAAETKRKPKPQPQPSENSNPKNKPKSKPKPKPSSPLDALPPPPNPHYHPMVSPRPGTDISPQNQLTALRCQNQTKCIVPELQLEAKLKIYFCRHPARHGVRFYYLVREGLHLHPNVELLPFESINQADFVVYLPGSSPWHLTECTNASLHSKLLVLDEFDGYNMFHPFERIEQVEAVYGKSLMWYFMYFKRSFVARKDGKFLSHPHLSQPDVYPITYAIADAYVNYNFNFQRSIDVLCTLRGSSKMITRMRVQEWIAEYALSRNIVNAITEQVGTLLTARRQPLVLTIEISPSPFPNHRSTLPRGQLSVKDTSSRCSTPRSSLRSTLPIGKATSVCGNRWELVL